MIYKHRPQHGRCLGHGAVQVWTIYVSTKYKGLYYKRVFRRRNIEKSGTTIIEGSRVIPSFRNDAPKGCSHASESQPPVVVSCLLVVRVHPTELTTHQLMSLAARFGDHEGNFTYLAVTFSYETRYFGHVLLFGQTLFKGLPRF